ncbi:TetR/AcrR family transcriptional regulator [Lachnospiraceae bacterium]|nr:TetR/AcrR family transcriptional regulator [uncultured Schaedlerella sp.]EOS40047.1 hypothetical protein C808_01018 [Lachnospiraceae bacterium M18-1]MCI9154470.1 TetR/AcrR family transcriptional regulator [Ruminococcus sp.]NBI57794.1 TetR/AcrR family transcriptional regulator [Lachnospiraceae bacterium]
MNTKQNLRFQQTEQNIRKVFTELLKKEKFEKITVSRICELCQINRSSFYLHYKDVYDLIDKIEYDMSSYFAHIFIDDSPLNMNERFIKLFTFILENKEFYKAYLNSADWFHTIHGIIPESAQFSLNAFAQKLSIQSLRELRYHQVFFTYGLTALIREWLNQGCLETPKELGAILNQEYLHHSVLHDN